MDLSYLVEELEKIEIAINFPSRDALAATAMQGIIASGKYSVDSRQAIVDLAYEMADAMIARRNSG